MALGRQDEAVIKFQEAIDLGLDGPQAFMDLGLAYRVMGKEAEAMAIWEQVREMPYLSTNRSLTVQALLGEPEQADARAAEVAANNAAPHMLLAYYHFFRGRLDEGIDELERAAEAGESSGFVSFVLLWYVPQTPGLLEHPRFQAWLDDNDIIVPEALAL